MFKSSRNGLLSIYVILIKLRFIGINLIIVKVNQYNVLMKQSTSRSDVLDNSKLLQIT